MRVLVLFICAAVAFASEEVDDGSGSTPKTCAEKYNECRKDAEIHDIKTIYKCGKEYTKCRFAPAVTCVKDCHTKFLTCRKTGSILDRAQCYVDLAKCYTTCKIAPHHEDEDEDFDDILYDEDEEMDDGSCGTTLAECKKNSNSLKEKAKCYMDYAKCRSGPLGKCLQACHVTRKTCTASATGGKEHLKCFQQFFPCAASCRLAPHFDEIIEDEEDYDLMEDEEELDDGSGGKQTCGTTLAECKKNSNSLKDKAKCYMDYLKCRSGPLNKCLQACHVTRKTCTASATGAREHLKCFQQFFPCAKSCRIAPHNDEIIEDEEEDYNLMEDEEELDDGSGGKQTCREEYRECAKADSSITGRLKCGKEYLKCKARPRTKCLRKCHMERKTCTTNAKSMKDHWECLKGFPKCYKACREGQQ